MSDGESERFMNTFICKFGGWKVLHLKEFLVGDAVMGMK